MIETSESLCYSVCPFPYMERGHVDAWLDAWHDECTMARRDAWPSISSLSQRDGAWCQGRISFLKSSVEGPLFGTRFMPSRFRIASQNRLDPTNAMDRNWVSLLEVMLSGSARWWKPMAGMRGLAQF